MLIAHVPAGYLFTRYILSRSAVSLANRRALFLLGLSASVLPDIDMLYFYLIDMRQHHHHTYWTHLPIFWIAVFVPLALIFKRWPKIRLAVIVAGLNIALHLMLDSIVGDIWWLSPFVDRPYALFTVPAAHGHWVLNFVLHWSFVLELLIVGIAAIIWSRKCAALQ